MAHSQIHDQLADLETRWAYADMNAERLDDAAGPGGGDVLRLEAAEIRAEIQRIQAAHGIDPVTGELAHNQDFTNRYAGPFCSCGDYSCAAMRNPERDCSHRDTP